MAGYRDLVADRRRADRLADVFVAEGARTVETLLEVGWPLRSMLVSEARAVARADLVAAAEAAGADVYCGDGATLAGIAGYPVHRGIIALAERPAPRSVEQVLAEAGGRGCHLVLVLEGINDLENMGALFRNAAAFGVGAVLLDPTSADPLYRRSVRVSLGHVLRIPFARCRTWPGDLDRLSAAGYRLLALCPRAATTVEEVAADRSGSWAVMVGSEGDGLSPDAMAAGSAVGIPIEAGVDSLNVATAAAIALQHLYR